MSNLYKLSELFNMQMGKTPARNNSKYWDNGIYPWISISDFSNNGKFIKTTKEKITDMAVVATGIKPISTGTVIMSFKLSIGKVAVVQTDESKTYSNEAIMAFEIKKDLPAGIGLTNEYLYYLLSSIKFDNIGNKAVMGKTLNRGILENIKVTIHSFDKQKKIVAVLDKITYLIDKQKQGIKKLDEIIKSRFVEMFGDPEINPMEWSEKPLSELLNVISGYAFKSELFAESGIPVLRIGNINTGIFQAVNMVYWKEDKKLERYKVYPGDLVMSLTGTVGKDDYGNVCILDNEYDAYYLNQRNAKFQIKGNINKYYLSELLKFPQIKKRLTGISRGVRQANISNQDILNLQVPIPNIEKQVQYGEFVHLVNKSKFEVQKSLEKLELLKKSLMQKYFG